MKNYYKFKVINLYGGAALTEGDENNPFTCPVCLDQYDNSMLNQQLYYVDIHYVSIV